MTRRTDCSYPPRPRLCERASSGTRTGRCALARIAAATIRSQEIDQGLHDREVGAVADEATALVGADQTRVLQRFQMKRQGCSGDFKLVGDIAGTGSFGSQFDQPTKYG